MPNGTAEVHFLTLGSSATLEAIRLGVVRANPSWSRQYSKQLQLHRRVAEWLHRLGGLEKCADPYGLTFLISNAVLWREWIRFAISNVPYDAVQLPMWEKSEASACQPRSLSQELKWTTIALRRAIVEEETVNLPLASALGTRLMNQETTDSAGRMIASVLPGVPARVSGIYGAIARKSALGLRWPSSTVWNTQPASLAKAKCRVLVLAQEGKISQLATHRRPWIDWQHLSYGEFHKLCDAREENYCSASNEPSSQGLVARYAAVSESAVTRAKSAVRKLAESSAVALITDAQHDLFVRPLVEEFLRSGKAVAFVPEGCSAYSGLLEPFGESLYLRNDGVTRFVIDEHQQRHWAAHSEAQGKLLVSGYLGNTLPSQSGIVRFVRSIRRRRLQRYLTSSERPVATLTLDAFLSQWEVARVGDYSMSERLQDYVDLLRRLDQEDINVIAKSRDQLLIQLLKERFIWRHTYFTTSTDWQTCVEVSDALVTRDSSVAWEAVRCGVPTIVFNLADYPSTAEEAIAEENAEHFVVVRSLDDLVSTLKYVASTQRLLSGERRRKVEWISTANMRVVESWLKSRCALADLGP